MKKKGIKNIFILLICVSSSLYADWDDITITQDTQISDGDQYVRVFVNSINNPTTINLTGGQVGTLLVYNDSIVNIDGGVFKQEFYNYHPENNDGDNLFLAPYLHSIYLEDLSVLNYYGADLQTVLCAHQSTINIFNGIISLVLAGNSQVNIMGGEITSISPTRYFSSPKCASHVSISGGTFSGKVALIGNCVADIYGYGFVYDPDGWVSEDPRFFRTEGGQLRGFWADGTPFSIDFFNSHFHNSYSHVILHEVPMMIQMDIKPQSCPNPVNVKSKGVLPVAILGSDVFDVNRIDPNTILLEGVSPIRCSYKDVATTVLEEAECACTIDNPDSYIDLTLKFETQEIVNVLGKVIDGEEWLLYLTGTLKDGTEIEGSDCVVIQKKGK